jgi:hypothetical protein
MHSRTARHREQAQATAFDDLVPGRHGVADVEQ